MSQSVSESCLSDLFVSELEDDVGGTVAQEDGHATGQKTTVEAFNAVRLHDVLGSLKIAVANAYGLCLCQVLHHLEGPDKPVSEHGS